MSPAAPDTEPWLQLPCNTYSIIIYHARTARIRLNTPINIHAYERTSCPHTRRLCATGRTVVRRTQPGRGAAARADADTAACHCGTDRGAAYADCRATYAHCRAAHA